MFSIVEIRRGGQLRLKVGMFHERLKDLSIDEMVGAPDALAVF